MSSVISSLIIAAGSAAWAIFCALVLRSDRYIRQTLESYLRSRRQPVTPDAIARLVPGAKAALIIGIVAGVAIAILGLITLVIGMATVLKGS